MITMNESFLNAMLRHQIYLLRYSASLRNSLISILNASEEDMADKLRARLQDNAGLIRSSDYERLNRLIDAIKVARTAAWGNATAHLLAETRKLAHSETGHIAGILASSSPVVLSQTRPEAKDARAIVAERPFEGRLLKDWASKMAADDLARIENVVMAGVASGLAAEQIVRNVIGTTTMRGRDGITQMSRNAVDAIVTTAVMHVASQARNLFLDMNRDIISFEMLIAVLDGGTTAQCRALDKKRYIFGTGPQPPLHVRCRTIRVASMNVDAILKRPAKPATEKMMLREFTKREGLSSVSDRANLPYGFKTKFDLYSRDRIRELTGGVPAVESYQTWLSKQSAEFQDDVLGKTKGKLFRDGKMPLSKFVNQQGRELTLEELSARYATAFREAGLDPSKY